MFVLHQGQFSFWVADNIKILLEIYLVSYWQTQTNSHHVKLTRNIVTFSICQYYIFEKIPLKKTVFLK